MAAPKEEMYQLNERFVKFLVVFVVVVASLASYAQTEDEDELPNPERLIRLTLGLEDDIDLPALPKKIDMKGDYKRIVTAIRSKDLKSLKLVPIREGFAALTIHEKKTGRTLVQFRIEVKKSTLDKVTRELQTLLGDIEGISIKVVNNKVLIDGQVLLPKDLRRISNVVKQYGDQASSLVTMSPIALKKITEFIARDINNPEIEVRTVNDWIILQGYANTESEKKRAGEIAQLYLPEIVNYVSPEGDQSVATVQVRKSQSGVPLLNLIEVKPSAPEPPSKLVQIVVHFVELSKDYQKSFKFSFLPQIDDQSGVKFSSDQSVGTVISGTINSLLPKLNWLKAHGHARVLESTTILVENSKQGMIRQETDQPYPISGPDGSQGIGFAKVGLKTTITPTISNDKSGSVRLEMNFELSSLQGFKNEAPIVARNEMSTAVSVRDRQSAAIGGLIKNDSSTNYNSPPDGQSNAIISLYASKDFQRKQSQFVVFVTPIIKTSASSGAEQIKKKFRLRE